VNKSSGKIIPDSPWPGGPIVKLQKHQKSKIMKIKQKWAYHTPLMGGFHSTKNGVKKHPQQQKQTR
jgi:hypothetical protein